MTLSTHNGEPCAYASENVAQLVQDAHVHQVPKSRQIAPWLVLGAILALFIVTSVLGVVSAGDLVS
jgi:cell division protein FtsB